VACGAQERAAERHGELSDLLDLDSAAERRASWRSSASRHPRPASRSACRHRGCGSRCFVAAPAERLREAYPIGERAARGPKCPPDCTALHGQSGNRFETQDCAARAGFGDGVPCRIRRWSGSKRSGGARHPRSERGPTSRAKARDGGPCRIRTCGHRVITDATCNGYGPPPPPQKYVCQCDTGRTNSGPY